MSKKSVKKNLSNKLDVSSGSLNKWDTAISDAEKRIQTAKDRIRKLRGAIQVFKVNRDNGAPFPSEKSEPANS